MTEIRELLHAGCGTRRMGRSEKGRTGRVECLGH